MEVKQLIEVWSSAVYDFTTWMKTNIHPHIPPPEKKPGKKKKKKSIDFAKLLQETSRHFEIVNKIYPKLEKAVVVRCTKLRHRFAHQDTMTEKACLDAINILITLAEQFDWKEEKESLELKISKFVDKKEDSSSSMAIDQIKKMMEEGDNEISLGRYIEAIDKYTIALENCSEFKDILFFQRSFSYMKLKKFEFAELDAIDCISINPNYHQAYHLAAQISLGKKNFKEALDYIDQAIKLDPKNTVYLKDRREILSEFNVSFWKDNEVGGLDHLNFQEKNGFDIQRKIDLLKSHGKFDVTEEDKKHFDMLKNTFPDIMKAHQYKDRENLSESFKYFEIATKAGNPEAKYNLALFYQRGMGGTKVNNLKSLELLIEVSNCRAFCDIGLEILGVSLAQNALGIHYRDGIGVDIDYKRAFEWFLKSANNGCVLGMNNTGYAFRNGQGTSVDYEFAFGWFQEAVKLDYGNAMVNIGDMYRYGLGVKVDLSEAMKYYTKAREKCVPGIATILSDLELEEISINSKEKSMKQLRLSAENGELVSMFQLGMLILDGEDVVEKITGPLLEGLEWIRKAANKKQPQACIILGGIYFKSKDLPQAEKYFRFVADSGDMDGLMLLADCLYNQCKWRESIEVAKKVKARMPEFKMERYNLDKCTELEKKVKTCEQKNDLSSLGMTFSERVIRLGEKEIGLSLINPSLIGPMKKMPSYTQNDKRMPWNLEQYINTSSVAKRLYDAGIIFFELQEHLSNGNNSNELLKMYVQAIRIDVDACYVWLDENFMPSMLNIAEKQVKINSNDRDATITICMLDGTKSPAIRLKKALNAQIAFPDEFLITNSIANFYAFLQDIKSVQNYKKAIKLNPDKCSPYYAAGYNILMLEKDKIKKKEGVDFLNKFISITERDERKVPEAHFCLSQYYLSEKNLRKMKEHYLLALEADKVGDKFWGKCEFPIRGMLENLIKFRLSLEEKNCFNCEGAGKFKCSKCKKTLYCSVECQKEDWSFHKLFCNK
jgi:TPR repeat protein